MSIPSRSQHKGAGSVHVLSRKQSSDQASVDDLDFDEDRDAFYISEEEEMEIEELKRYKIKHSDSE